VPDWSNLAVTTHIIGKPPAPKGGATFGDVPDRHVFSMPWRNGIAEPLTSIGARVTRIDIRENRDMWCRLTVEVPR